MRAAMTYRLKYINLCVVLCGFEAQIKKPTVVIEGALLRSNVVSMLTRE